MWEGGQKDLERGEHPDIDLRLPEYNRCLHYMCPSASISQWRQNRGKRTDRFRLREIDDQWLVRRGGDSALQNSKQVVLERVRIVS